MDIFQKIEQNYINSRGRYISNRILVESKSGDTITLTSSDQHTIDLLQSLHLFDIFSLLNITKDDLIKYLKDRRTYLEETTKWVLSNKWIDIYEDRPFEFDECCVAIVPLNPRQIRDRLKLKRNNLSDAQLEAIIQFFLGERSQVKPAVE